MRGLCTDVSTPINLNNCSTTSSLNSNHRSEIFEHSVQEFTIMQFSCCNLARTLLVWFILLCPFAWGQASGQNDKPAKLESNTTQLAKGQESQSISIEAFSWLEGCWDGTGLGGKCTELWSGPEGNLVIGSFRYVSDDKVVFTEHFVIRKEGDSVALLLKHFDSDLKGWEEKDKRVTFKFVKQDGDNFMFEGLTYRRIGKDKMEVYVVIEENSKRQEAKFEFTRKR
jgi:Domain of unknown function (DUF6265)